MTSLHSPTFCPTLCAGFGEHQWNNLILTFAYRSNDINRLRLSGLSSYSGRMPVGVTKLPSQGIPEHAITGCFLRFFLVV